MPDGRGKPLNFSSKYLIKGGKMALTLRLDSGEIRTYRTSYSSWGENPTHHAKCGMFWVDCPKQEEECDHLDCAIEASKHGSSQSLIFLAFCLLFIAWGGSRIVGTIFEGGWTILMAAIGVMIFALAIYELHRSSMSKNELTEFRDKGTIGGTRAWKDP